MRYLSLDQVSKSAINQRTCLDSYSEATKREFAVVATPLLRVKSISSRSACLKEHVSPSKTEQAMKLVGTPSVGSKEEKLKRKISRFLGGFPLYVRA